MSRFARPHRWPRQILQALQGCSCHLVAVTGLLVALALGYVTHRLVQQDRDEALEAEARRGVLLATVLESHVSRTLGSLGNTFDLISAGLEGGAGVRASSLADFQPLIAGSTYLRSLSLVDASGRVLASSSPQNLGLQIDWSRLGFAAAPGARLALGQPLFGRDIASGLAAGAGADHSIHVIPVARRLVGAERQAIYALAALNPDYLLPDGVGLVGEGGHSALFDHGGHLLATSGQTAPPVGTALPQMEAVRQVRSEVPAGRYLESLPAARAPTMHQQLVSFRGSRNLPLAVGVWLSADHVIAEADASSVWMRWAGYGGATLILLASLVLARAMRTGEMTRRNLREARDKAERANTAKSVFLANMSHEIRTPINSMVGMTELALTTPLTVQQREYLTLAKSSSQTLLRLIDDILDFSRIEAGRMELDRAAFDLHPLCQQALKNLSLQAGQKGLELILDIQPGVPDSVVGDALRLNQVLLNLLGNALKFTPAGWVKLSVRHLKTDGPTHTLEFEVRDSGIGIALPKQREIFKAFTQEDVSTTRRFGGSGLGLAISKRLVELMGGKISVKSTPGQGSAFRFTCQLGQAAASDVQRLPLLLAAAAQIVVVDPNPLSREVITRQLRDWRLEPLPAGTLREFARALRSLASQRQMPVTVVVVDGRLLDLQLQLMLDEFKPAIRERLRFIVLQSVTDSAEQLEGLPALSGAYRLRKPATPGELHDALEAAAEGRGASQAPLDTQPGGLGDLIDPETGRAAAPLELRVLVVEDTPMNQKLVQSVLTVIGARCEIANEGREGLRMRQQGQYDLVLMDLQMPVMDGLEATRRIRAWETETGAPRVPIVAMTAHGLQKDRDECLAAGMDEFLVKPVTLSEFARVVRASLARRPAAAPAAGRPAPNSGFASTLPQAPSRSMPAPLLEGGAYRWLEPERARHFVNRPDVLRQMLSVLDGSLTEDAEGIRQALAQARGPSAAELLHPLKGYLPVFCAEPLVRDITELEGLCRRGEVEAARPVADRVLPALETLAHEVHHFLEADQTV
jgi:signal transduction histidine kinase/DNA-binding response OmpR family regulator